MNELKFTPDYISWKRQFDTEPVYTRRQMAEALERCSREYQVNRVIQSFNGQVGPSCSIAMQILAVHKTPDGVVVIVR